MATAPAQRTLTQLEFGIWDQVRPYEFQHFGGAPAVLEQHIRLAQLTDRLGFGNYWTIEHHSSHVGGITSPSVWLTALARETGNIRLGAMIWQLPFHNPLRLTEEVALLDQLSGGRAEFGTGIGVHEHEFLRWGLDFGQRQAMGEEALEIIERAWAQGTVGYDGRYWKFDEAILIPRPYQRPRPPIWAAVHSARSIEFAASRNYHVAMNIDTDQQMAEKFRQFREAWARHRHAGPMPRQFLMRHVHVAETDEAAIEEAAPHLPASWSLGRELVTGTRIGMGTSPRGTGTEQSPDILERGRVFRECGRSSGFWIENGLAHVGSPATVTRRIRQAQRALGFTDFVACFHIGAMPPETVEKSVRLFGQEVIPALRAAAS